MKEHWYLSKPVNAFDAIGSKEFIKTGKTPLIEFTIEKDCGLLFANCKNPHFQVNAKTYDELLKNIEQTYSLIEGELRRVYAKDE